MFSVINIVVNVTDNPQNDRLVISIPSTATVKTVIMYLTKSQKRQMNLYSNNVLVTDVNASISTLVGRHITARGIVAVR